MPPSREFSFKGNSRPDNSKRSSNNVFNYEKSARKSQPFLPEETKQDRSRKLLFNDNPSAFDQENLPANMPKVNIDFGALGLGKLGF